MKRNLPRIFQNDIPSGCGNNDKVYYSKYEKEEATPTVRSTPHPKTSGVRDAILAFFANNRYLYTKDVRIRTGKGSFTTRLAGRTQEELFTLENERIPISEILEFEVLKK